MGQAITQEQFQAAAAANIKASGDNPVVVEEQTKLVNTFGNSNEMMSTFMDSHVKGPTDTRSSRDVVLDLFGLDRDVERNTNINFALNAETGEREFTVGEATLAPIIALTDLLRMRTGEVALDPVQMFKDVFQLTPAGVGKPNPSQLGMMLRRSMAPSESLKSKRRFKVAEKMREDGFAAEDILQKQGIQTINNIQYIELSDVGAGWKGGFAEKMNDALNDRGDLRAQMIEGAYGGRARDMYRFTLGDVFKHKDLYEAYPGLENFTLQIFTRKYSTDPGGSFDWGNKNVNLFVRPEEFGTNQGLDRILSTMLHELQHGVDRTEGTDIGSGNASHESERLNNEEKKIRDVKSIFEDAFYTAENKGIDPRAFDSREGFKREVYKYIDDPALLDTIRRNMASDDRFFSGAYGEDEAASLRMETIKQLATVNAVISNIPDLRPSVFKADPNTSGEDATEKWTGFKTSEEWEGLDATVQFIEGKPTTDNPDANYKVWNGSWIGLDGERYWIEDSQESMDDVIRMMRLQEEAIPYHEKVSNLMSGNMRKAGEGSRKAWKDYWNNPFEVIARLVSARKELTQLEIDEDLFPIRKGSDPATGLPRNDPTNMDVDDKGFAENTPEYRDYVRKIKKALSIEPPRGSSKKTEAPMQPVSKPTTNTALVSNAKKINPDITDTKIPGFHGTVGERTGAVVWDKAKMNKRDQFISPGAYFSLEPTEAIKHANKRAIRDLQVVPGQGNKPVYYRTPNGERVTVQSILDGTDVHGAPINAGQNIIPVNLANLDKTYMIKNNKDRLWVKDNWEQLQAEGYDSVAFKNFSDNQKQIVVFPEHIGKVIKDIDLRSIMPNWEGA